MRLKNNLFYFILLFFILAQVGAQSFTNRLRVPIKLYTSVSYGYDSNVFRLSNLEIKDYESHEVLGWNIPIINSEGFDNAYITPKVSIKYSPYIFDKVKTEFKFSIHRNIYLSIPEKSYSIYNSELGIKLGSYRWIRLSHRYLPEYYLRNFFDRDYSVRSYYECLFSSESFQISYSHPIFRKTWLRLKYGKTRLLYDSHFSEFDVDGNQIELKLYFKLFDYENSLSFSTSEFENISYLNGYQSTSFDRSYNEFIYGFTSKQKIKSRLLRGSVGGSAIIKHRLYKEESPLDPLHTGREHWEYNFSLWVSNKINNRFSQEIKLKYRDRDIKSDEEIRYYDSDYKIAHGFVRDLKSFDKFEVIYKIVYNTNLDFLY